MGTGDVVRTALGRVILILFGILAGGCLLELGMRALAGGDPKWTSFRNTGEWDPVIGYTPRAGVSAPWHMGDITLSVSTCDGGTVQ
jgi:hypothetical protein